MMVGLIVMLVGILRLGWIAEFLSTPIITGFLSGVAVIIIVHQLPDLFGLPPTDGTNQHRVASTCSPTSTRSTAGRSASGWACWPSCS